MSEPKPIRVLIVEDQGLVLAFFERWLEELPRFQCVGAVRSGEEALRSVEAMRPDVAMVDLQLPGMDGLEFVRAARQVRPQLHAIVVSSLVDPLALTRVKEAGVEGYVEKDATPELLREALQSVADGREFFSPRFREVLAHEAAKAEGIGKILSRREQQVLTAVLEGKTNREIGEALGLSVRTVEFHRANVMGKLGAGSYEDLAAEVRQRRWK